MKLVLRLGSHPSHNPLLVTNSSPNSKYSKDKHSKCLGSSSYGGSMTEHMVLGNEWIIGYMEGSEIKQQCLKNTANKT